MQKIGLTAGLLALLASAAGAAAPFDSTDWITFKVEDARLAQRIPDAFIDDADRAAAVDHLKTTKAFTDDVEDTVRRAALDEKLGIVQAKVSGTIGPDEAAAETARLDKALQIHLCYIYGSLVPRLYDGAFGAVVSASLRAAFVEHLKRADYLALLKASPTATRLDRPIPAMSDGR